MNLLKETRNLIALLCACCFCSWSWSKEIKCSEHANFLLIKEHGFEHVNHSVLLNGKVPVEELEREAWFIESVKCKPKGYEIVASHVQYGDSTKQKFILEVFGPLRYELKKGS